MIFKNIQNTQHQGLIYGASCYIIWGVFPLYWYMLKDIPSLTILNNRIIWSAFFLLIFSFIKNRNLFFEIAKNPKNIMLMGVSGLIISINWGTYIYAVNNGFVIEASLGYFITPLVNIILSMILFKERLDKVEKIATLFALIGVCYYTISYGSFPFISLGLALSFSTYGLIKKKANLPTKQALTLETSLVAPLALTYLIYSIYTKQFVLSDLSLTNSLLLIFSGLVTAIPLLLFAKAIQNISYITLSFMQYIGPTIQLFIGVFIFKEVFTFAHWVCYIFIWIGLLLFTFNIIKKNYNQIKS